MRVTGRSPAGPRSAGRRRGPTRPHGPSPARTGRPRRGPGAPTRSAAPATSCSPWSWPHRTPRRTGPAAARRSAARGAPPLSPRRSASVLLRLSCLERPSTGVSSDALVGRRSKPVRRGIRELLRDVNRREIGWREGTAEAEQSGGEEGGDAAGARVRSERGVVGVSGRHGGTSVGRHAFVARPPY